MPHKFTITTLGCKANQCDGSEIARSLERLGLRPAPAPGEADLNIINTCCVTHKTDYQSRQLIRRTIRENPAAAVVVTGCYAGRAAEELTRIPGVDLVLGNREKDLIPGKIRDILRSPGSKSQGENRSIIPPGPAVPAGRTRAFYKIQDGCNSSCAYCVVPGVRGESRSLPPVEVVKGIAALGEAGYAEVVLTGIHLGAYGADFRPAASLMDIVEWAGTQRPVERIRLSSLEPTEIPPNLTDFMTAGSILCPHLHVPLQSGDDRILGAMGRPYTASFFRDRILRLFSKLPDLALGLDVIAGFPGEDEEAFQNTVHLLEELPLAYLHVFPFSRRPQTPAWDLPDQVDEREKNRRAKLLRDIGERKKGGYLKRFIGRELSVLVEREGENGLSRGLAENYLPVLLEGAPSPGGRIVKAVLKGLKAGRAYGSVG